MVLAPDAVPAVRLANAELCDLPTARAALAWHPLAERLEARDLVVLRGLAGRLHEVFALAAERLGDDAVDALNALLARSPVAPLLAQAGDDGAAGWRLHLRARGTAAGEQLAAEALVGLAASVAALGPGRLGLCAAAGCADAFVDTSPGGKRRYCSERCANRAHVAASRARRRSR